jgi:hypothetical protein
LFKKRKKEWRMSDYEKRLLYKTQEEEMCRGKERNGKVRSYV